MLSNFKMYKTIPLSDAVNLGISVSREYYFIENGVKKEINEIKFENSSNEKSFKLMEEEDSWIPNSNLILKISVSINNYSFIFGKNGYCYEDAKVGIGLVWKPEKSRIKKCVKLGEIFNTCEDRIFEKEIKLDNIFSNTPFNFFFYVVEPGSKNGSVCFANKPGMIFYDEIIWNIITDGNGSSFPCEIVSIEGEPLWWFRCDVDDVNDDLFDSEHIEIIFNSSHPSYKFIDKKSDTYNRTFLFDIIASALSHIIIKIRSNNDNKINFDEEYEVGSILSVLKYQKEKLGFKINDGYEELLCSIKKHLDKAAKHEN